MTLHVSSTMCSKHVKSWNILTVKQKFCASSWLITKIKKILDVLCDSQTFTDFSLKYHNAPALWIYVFKYFRHTSHSHFISSIKIKSAPLTSGKYVNQLKSYLTF